MIFALAEELDFVAPGPEPAVHDQYHKSIARVHNH